MWDNNIFAGTALNTGCSLYWTAGHRAAGAWRFVWNVTTNGLNAVTAMSYTNWDRGEPDYSGEACVYYRYDSYT